MRVVFSRKGFDSGSGGAPSPIVNGRPISLPIPTTRWSKTTYDDLGYGDFVERATKGKIRRSHLCHEDPMFHRGRCAFGQTGAAQSHLNNQKVDVGDVFLFFGLFADDRTGERHHRFFGYLIVQDILRLGSGPSADSLTFRFPRRHPHTIGERNPNNTVYFGDGHVARRAIDRLRLTVRGGPVSLWQVPQWLRRTGLTYHAEERWLSKTVLQTVSRGQEFVADIGRSAVACKWVDQTIREIKG